MTIIKTICIIFSVSLVFQQMISCYEIKDCTVNRNPDAELISLSVDSCPDRTADRCEFHKGTNATLQVEFETTKSFSQANIGIWGKLGPFYIPFKLEGPTDACSNYGFTCPTTVGQKQEFKISIPVLAQYPSISVSVRFEMNDEAKNPIVCFEFPVRLTTPPETAVEEKEESKEGEEEAAS